VNPRHDARLVPAALAAYVVAVLVVGEVVAPFLVGVAIAAVVGVAGIAAVVALWVARNRSTTPFRYVLPHVLLALCVAAVVVATAASHMEARWAGGFRDAVGAGAVDIRGTVVREPVPLTAVARDGTAQVRVEMDVAGWRANEGTAWRSARASVVLVGGEELAGLAHGALFDAHTSLDTTRGEEAVAIGWAPSVSNIREPDGAASAVGALRDGLRMATGQLSDTVRGLTRGMVIGDTRQMPQLQREYMRVTGLTHLTAVSGAHFAIIAVVLHWLLRQLRLPRMIRAGCAAAGMGAFSLLVFPDPSVVRALAMALTTCLALWWGRPAHALPALASAVIFLLLLDPHVALAPGFALSVSAVAAIVLWAPRLRYLLSRVMPDGLAYALSVPLAAQAACGPLLIMLEPRVSGYAVFANAIASVWAAPVTVLGLAAVLLGPVARWLAEAIAWMASLAVWPVAWVARVFADLPGAALAWPPGIAGALALAVLTAVVMWWTVPRGSWTLKTGASVMVLILIVLCVRADRTWDWAVPVPPHWAIVACDVGQGDMMLVRTGPSAAVVIDAGPGDGTASACLERFGITQVPLLILTHPHADHDGGVSEVLALAAVGVAWVPSIATQQGYESAVSTLAQAGVRVVAPVVGASWRDGDAALTVRQAGTTAVPVGGVALPGSALNDASLVIEGTSAEVSLLALGDLEDAGQRDLAAQITQPLERDVVKVPHHGSRTQDSDLVAAIRPQIAIVSVGMANDYGHPATETLDLYARHSSTVARTDECGDIVVWRDPDLRMASRCG